MSNDVKEIRRAYYLLKQLVKYGITLLAIMCTVHCGLLIIGHDLMSIHILLCAFLLILGLCLSHLFGLCWAHKLCVVYTCTVILCIVFKRYDVFFNLDISLEMSRTIMHSIGLFVIGAIIWKVQERNCCRN